MALGVALVFLTPLGNDLLTSEGPLVLGVFFVPFETPLQSSLLVIYSALISIYIICFFASSTTHGGFLSGLKAVVASNPLRLPNWLAVMPLVSSALFLVVVFISVIQESVGIGTGSLPVRPSAQTLYSLTYAPILEEWVFRISPIGFIVGLRTLAAKGTPVSFALGFISPERAKYKVKQPRFIEKGWRSVHWTEWSAVAVTSLVFGLAHVLAGSGWQLGKISTAALSGLVLAVVFLVYGAYASILLHWFFDFYFGVTFLFGEQIGGTAQPLDAFVSITTLAAGGIGLVLFAKWLLVSRQRES